MAHLDAQNLGQYGEQLVYQWLTQRHWRVIQQRWHSRFGEIDLIAQGHSGHGALRSEMIAFVEVKTRSQGNWDADGLLSLTRSKQRKLQTTARYFLVRHPYLSELPCRFDVALVRCQSAPPAQGHHLLVPNLQKYLTLQTYIPNAF